MAGIPVALIGAVVSSKVQEQAAIVSGIGNLPSTCGNGGVIQEGGPTSGHQAWVGRRPVWVIGEPQLTAGSGSLILHLALPNYESLKQPSGYEFGTTWLSQPGFTESIKIEVTDQGGVPQPVGSGVFDPHPARLLVLDPQHPETLADPSHSVADSAGYNQYSATFFVPGAGCYVMSASWPEGSWKVPLAVGP
jgi:hypothetical protein